MDVNETNLQAATDVISNLVSETPADNSGATGNAVSSTGKLALLAKAGKTDMLLLALLAGEFGPQISQGLAHVPGCG